jgi:hypothetical protein
MRSTIKLGALEAMKLHISELPYSDWHPTTLEPFELEDAPKGMRFFRIDGCGRIAGRS